PRAGRGGGVRDRGHRLLRRRARPLPCRQGQVVLEGNRPDRQTRRRRGQSDAMAPESAARTVHAGEATALPKAGTATVEMLRSLRVARATAIKARTQAINALQALVVTAPQNLREQL